MEPTEQSLQDRLYAVRLALGRPRKPMPFQALAKLLHDRCGVAVSWESLRRYEADGREPPLEVIAALAAVDPMQRGAAWIAWAISPDASATAGAADATTAPQPTGQTDGPVPDELIKEAPRSTRRGPRLA